MNLKNKVLQVVVPLTKADHPGDHDDDEVEFLEVIGYANTSDLDRGGDVVLPEAWEKGGLDDYLKNPIILAFHDHRKPIGVMIEHSVDTKGLRIRAKISDTSKEIFSLIKEGILQAFSIGFRVKDADYNATTDIFVIKDVELMEISVVSVPMNQNSLFSVAKNFEADDDYKEFKKSFSKPTPKKASPASNKPKEHNEDFHMEPEELAALVAKAVANTMATRDADEATKKADALAEQKRRDEIEALGQSGAEKLVKELQATIDTKNDDFTSKIEAMQTELAEKSDEIAAIISRSEGRHSFQDHNKAGKELDRSELADAYLLSKITSKDFFDTKLGKTLHEKAVNTSSSGVVSSEFYETIVSTNLQEDIQLQLVVEPLFRAVPMSAAKQIIPINPAAAKADWIAAAEVTGTRTIDGSTTGSEKTHTLTEILLQTFKLASKSYITDETEEDAIIAVLPILRQGLVDGHVEAIEDTFLNDTGVSSASPKGLIQYAIDAGTDTVTTAKADGSVLVSAKMLQQARRTLGKWGLDLRKLTVIVGIEAYWDLIEDPEFSNINEVGSTATKKTGQVGSMYGMSVLISREMPAKAVDAVYAVIVNSDNYLVPRLRGFTVQSDYDVENQRRVIVATQRLGLNQVIADAGIATAQYAAS